MRNKITRKTLSYVLSISFIFAFIVFCKPQNVYASYSRYVTASSLTVRKKASSKGKVKGYYKKGAKVTCYKKKGSWTRKPQILRSDQISIHKETSNYNKQCCCKLWKFQYFNTCKRPTGS